MWQKLYITLKTPLDTVITIWLSLSLERIIHAALSQVLVEHLVSTKPGGRGGEFDSGFACHNKIYVLLCRQLATTIIMWQSSSLERTVQTASGSGCTMDIWKDIYAVRSTWCWRKGIKLRCYLVWQRWSILFILHKSQKTTHKTTAIIDLVSGVKGVCKSLWINQASATGPAMQTTSVSTAKATRCFILKNRIQHITVNSPWLLLWYSVYFIVSSSSAITIVLITTVSALKIWRDGLG